MIFQLYRRVSAALLAVMIFSFTQHVSAVIRDGGVDPNNLGQGGWIYILKDATNHLAPSGVASVTNEFTLFKYLKNQGMSYAIVKAGTSNVLWTGSSNTNLPPMFTKKLVDAAHANGLKIFGSNRSWGNDIPGEVAVADYVFQQGADGFIYDAESEWESSQPWIGTNGPALAWQLCSTVRSNWPNKFIAHNPFDTAYLHFSFPFKEFGYWCDAVMPQVYHHAASKNNAIAAIHWSDYNYKRLQDYLTALPPTTNMDGSVIYWTNSIKPLVLMRDVYNGGAGTPVHPPTDVRNFLDYMAADPNCVTEGGYNGSDYFRSELHTAAQWANIKAATVGFASNIVNNIVIDDARATVVGNWTMVKTIDANVNTVIFSGEVSGDTNSFGTNYWRIGQGVGTNYMQFNPTVVQAGNYDIYEWHPTRADASTNVPVIINSSTGPATVFVNQQTNGGNWTSLGRFYFDVGTNATIQILDSFTETNRVASVDGLKMVFVPVVPAIPNGLRATTINSSQIDLSWRDNSTNELSFVISRSTAPGGPYDNVGLIGAGITNFSDTALLDSTIYYYVVRAQTYNNVDSPNSNEASALTPPGPPSITLQPTNMTAIEGGSATFMVEAASSTPITYQWLYKNEEIPGATESTYTLSNITSIANAGEYSVVVGNQVDSTVSAPAILSVNFFLSVSINPTSGGSAIIFPNQAGYTSNDVVSLAVSNNPGFIFVGWSGDVVSSSNSINVAMSSSRNLVANFLSTDDIILDNPDADYVGVWTIGSAASDKYGAYYQYATTGSGMAKAIYTPNILTAGKYDISIWYPQGTNRTSRAQVLMSHDGDSEIAEVDQTIGGGSWHRIAAGKEFSAGTAGFVSIGNNTGENSKIVVADAVRFSFNPAPIIFSQPQSQSVPVSSNATFQVLAGCVSPFTYQWQFNGTNIAGATTSVYTRNGVQNSDAGNYTVLLSNQVDVVSSEAAALTVTSVIPATINSISVSAENGFHFSLSGGANVTYTIETSTNLVDWIQLTNIFSADGNLEFTDPPSEGAARFYRARWVP
jgi:hypothetical protein